MIWCEWWGGAMRSIETLVTSQNAADCCKVFVGCRAWLQIRWPFFFSFYTPASLLAALLLVCTPAPCSVRPFQWLWRQQMRPPQQCSAGAVLIDLTSSGWWMADCDGLPAWTGLDWAGLT
ncbi:hypothetical protein J3E69DRAFT_13029 [Trichoderma sp. SZMC 28015]